MADNNKKYNAAVLIVAAGRGTRLSSSSQTLAKQYLELNGRAILAHAIQPFLDHAAICNVQVVIHPDDGVQYNDAIHSLNDPMHKLSTPVTGGDTRQISTRNGLAVLDEQKPDYVLIHDAARPFLCARTIDLLLETLETSEGAVPALPIMDTVKSADAHNTIGATIPREGLWRAQTPQAFHFKPLLAAHQDAATQDDHDFTDDASIAEAAGMTVHIVPGSEKLKKITTQDDLLWARQHIMDTQGHTMSELETRVGQGFDVHAFADGDAVVLCGVKIPFSKRLSGHSDADVGLHALTDAILGALGDGDIGTHFPPSDPQWKGADSVLFLEDAARRVTERNGDIRHIDITLICEAPKIGPHRAAMTTRLGGILDLASDRISIKATTTEGLGFPGRGEGIAALATATLAVPNNK